MCYDPQTDALFVLGQYVGQTLQSPPIKSDFFMYDLKQNKWTQLCDHTAVSQTIGLFVKHNSLD